MKISKLVCLVFALIGVKYSYSQPNKLDVSFNGTGLQSTTFDDHDVIKKTAIQNDGKIVAVGFSENTSNIKRIAMARYNVNGSLDNTFGNGGKVMMSFNAKGDAANSVVIQSDGKILIGGVTDESGSVIPTVFRCNSDGTLDSTFNGTGILSLSDTYGEINSIILQSDGKILAGGGRDFSIIRLNTNGSFDSTFGGTGRIKPVINMPRDEVFVLMLQKDGKIVAAGKAYFSLVKQDFCIARFNTDGSFDNSFSSDGKVILDMDVEDDFPSAALQSDGKIILAGSVDSDLFLFRYNSDGSLDNTFGTNGKATETFKEWGAARDVAIQTDGKIVVVGSVLNGIANIDFLTIRFNSSGKKDFAVYTGFNSNEEWEQAYSVSLQNDGKIIVAGFNYAGFGIARYMGGKSLEIANPIVLDNEVKLYPNPVNNHIVVKYNLIKESKITIQLLDFEGKDVITFVKDESQNIGQHSVNIELPGHLASGTYFLRISNIVGYKDIKILK
ncbi:MAG: T9SS type A sorting domain-containing protein [Flavobacteriales bacterium]|nr:T9SS type A sorting domain-containing protein [Flavobacteriales bacterium]